MRSQSGRVIRRYAGTQKLAHCHCEEAFACPAFFGRVADEAISLL